MKKLIIFGLVISLLFMAACDNQMISQGEKKVAESKEPSEVKITEKTINENIIDQKMMELLESDQKITLETDMINARTGDAISLKFGIKNKESTEKCFLIRVNCVRALLEEGCIPSSNIDYLDQLVIAPDTSAVIEATIDVPADSPVNTYDFAVSAITSDDIVKCTVPDETYAKAEFTLEVD